MADTRNQPELETLSYKPTIAELEEILEKDGGNSIEIMPNGEIKAKKKYCPDCGNTRRKDRKGWPIQYCGNPCPTKPASTSPAPMGFNSIVVKPEKRVNSSKVAGQPKGNHSSACASLNHPYADCTCVEQPNQNLMIITEVEGLMSQVNEKLGNIVITQELVGDSVRKLRRSQALEEIDLFQKTTLFELRKAFE